MRSFVYALKIRVLLAALAVMPTVCAALIPLPPPLAATALYPSSGAVANKATLTLSARYDNPAGSAGTVRFEVYDVGGITLVATGIGPSVLPGARSSWTVPTGLLVSGRAYQWRAQAQGATTWSALTDLGIDVVNGVSIPDAAPLPASPGPVSAIGADGGAWVTWSQADAGPGAEIDHYEIRARQPSGSNAELNSIGTKSARTESPSGKRVDTDVIGPPLPIDHLFTTTPDRLWKAVGSLSNATSYEWSVRAVSIYGPGPWASAGMVGGSPVPGGAAAFAQIAQSYLNARGQLLMGSAQSASDAINASPYAAAISNLVSDIAPTDLDVRSFVALHGVRYTSYASSLGENIAYWSGPGTVTLQAYVEETLGQLDGAITADPAKHAMLHTFSFSQTAQNWLLTADVVPGDGAPDLVPPTDPDPSDAPDVLASLVPLQLNSDGTLANGPELVEPMSAALDYYAISGYVHRYAYSYNSYYRRYPNDCTNFASQALRAGRMPFSWDALAYYRADFAWWYEKWRNWPIVASYTWAGAGNFARFLLNHHHASVTAYQNQAAVGDIILWDYGQNGDINHVSVVVRRIGNNVYYGQHSTDRDNELLANGIARARRECRCNLSVKILRVTG